MKDKKETNRERSAYTLPGICKVVKYKNLGEIIIFDAKLLHQAVQSRSFDSKNASCIHTYTTCLSQVGLDFCMEKARGIYSLAEGRTRAGEGRRGAGMSRLGAGLRRTAGRLIGGRG